METPTGTPEEDEVVEWRPEATDSFRMRMVLGRSSNSPSMAGHLLGAAEVVSRLVGTQMVSRIKTRIRVGIPASCLAVEEDLAPSRLGVASPLQI